MCRRFNIGCKELDLPKITSGQKNHSINKNLNSIAAVVGGEPLPLSSPEGIVNVFLQAIVALGPGS